jgi:hypothetical protein
MEGNRTESLGRETANNRAVDGFPRAAGERSRPVGGTSSNASQTLRARLISATVAIVAEGGDPRLVETLARP